MRRARSTLLSALALLAACARPDAASPLHQAASGEIPPFVTPSFIAPDTLPASHRVSTQPDGSRRFLISGLRILEHPDGAREQATTLLPAGLYRPIDLPPRLGGGLLFIASAGGTTIFYRAPSWLGELSPLARIPEAVRELVTGFDRLYLRISRGDEWIALDPEAGERVSLGALPEGTRLGPLVFADAWRAVAIADLRGPLATFDAGESFHPVPLDDGSVAVAVREGDDFILASQSGRYRLEPDGEISEASLAKGTEGAKTTRPPAPPPQSSPLRALLESGWPESSETALLAREGALHRVRIRDGARLASQPNAYDPRLGGCRALPFGETIGFVCGAPSGETSIQIVEPSFRMREVRRFSEPRVVVSSGRGGMLVRGRCGPLPERRPPKPGLCSLAPDGGSRDIPLPQGMGTERAAILSDGRIALVSRPSEGSLGQLAFLNRGGSEASRVPLRLRAEAEVFQEGVLLEGLEEIAPGTLGGWLDTGPTLRGVRIDHAGEVSLSELAVDTSTTIASGRFALALGTGSHRVRESTDFGFHFSDVDLPPNLPRASVEARACGPIGCVAGGWLRIGWGEAEARTVTPKAPSVIATPRVRGPSLQCEPTGEVSGGPKAKPLFTPGRGELSLEGGTDPTNRRILVPSRLYAWGPKGAPWSRDGRLVITFEDRFHVEGRRVTSLSRSPFADEASAESLLGRQGGPPALWNALLDPSGEAALLLACRKGSCASFGAVDGRPALPLSGLEVSSATDISAVRVGERWFVLAPPAGKTAQHGLNLFRIDEGGRATALTSFPRAWAGREDTVRLIRRARSEGLGLLTLGSPNLEHGGREHYVLPFDEPTNTLGPPVRLYGSHLPDEPPPCDEDEDGWLVDAQPSPPPALRVIATSSASAKPLAPTGVRLRMEPGRACIEAITARGEDLSALAAPRSGQTEQKGRSFIPLTATDLATGLRHGLRCVP